MLLRPTFVPHGPMMSLAWTLVLWSLDHAFLKMRPFNYYLTRGDTVKLEGRL